MLMVLLIVVIVIICYCSAVKVYICIHIDKSAFSTFQKLNKRVTCVAFFRTFNVLIFILIFFFSSPSSLQRLFGNSYIFPTRKSAFKEDDGTWRGNEDGKVVNNQPTRVMDDRNGVFQAANYIGR